jgi:hypothetical protein
MENHSKENPELTAFAKGRELDKSRTAGTA